MKPLSPALFELFDYDDRNDLRQEGLTGAVLDYTRHPYIIFGTFIRSVENFFIICQTYRNTYGEKFDKIEERLKHHYFDRVYGFLERFDETQLEHIIEAKQFTDSEILYAVKSVLDFYESIEDYRKCDRLWKILLLTVGEKVGRT